MFWTECHWITFVQARLDFVKDTTMAPSVHVAVPLLFQTPSRTISRKWATVVQKTKLENTSKIMALWYSYLRCWVRRLRSHKGTWCKWDIQFMIICSCLMQSASISLQSLQREKPGWSWLEAHDFWRSLTAPLSIPEFHRSPGVIQVLLKAFQNHTWKMYVFHSFGCLFTWQRS